MNSISKKKSFLIISIIFVIFWLITDLFYSRFINNDNSYGCLNFNKKNNFYDLKQNCSSNEKIVKTSFSYQVHTDKHGYRFSGKEIKDEKKDKIVFLGDSFTYGVGLNYEQTFVGKMHKIIDDYELLNLAVPSYSPTTYLYQLQKLIEKNIFPKKIFLVLDLTDVSDEASRWTNYDGLKKPILRSEKNNDGQNNNDRSKSFKDFKNKNFKGTRIILSYLNNQTRLIRIKFRKKIRDDYSELGITKTGDFTYKDGLHNDPRIWQPLGFNGGLKRVETRVKQISDLSKKINADLYIVVYPWAVTLEHGQKVFNWENFVRRLCEENKCKKFVSLFDSFNEEKRISKNWSTDLFFLFDTHWNEKGHSLVSKELLKEIF